MAGSNVPGGTPAQFKMYHIYIYATIYTCYIPEGISVIHHPIQE